MRKEKKQRALSHRASLELTRFFPHSSTWPRIAGIPRISTVGYRARSCALHIFIELARFPELPQADQREQCKIGKQERGHCRSAVDKIVEHLRRRAVQVGTRVVVKSEH